MPGRKQASNGLIELVYFHLFPSLTLFPQVTTNISQNIGISLGKLEIDGYFQSASNYGIKENDAQHQCSPSSWQDTPHEGLVQPHHTADHPPLLAAEHFLGQLLSFLFVNDWHIELKTPLALTRVRCKKTSILIHWVFMCILTFRKALSSKCWQ